MHGGSFRFHIHPFNYTVGLHANERNFPTFFSTPMKTSLVLTPPHTHTHQSLHYPSCAYWNYCSHTLWSVCPLGVVVGITVDELHDNDKVCTKEEPPRRFDLSSTCQLFDPGHHSPGCCTAPIKPLHHQEGWMRCSGCSEVDGFPETVSFPLPHT